MRTGWRVRPASPRLGGASTSRTLPEAVRVRVRVSDRVRVGVKVRVRVRVRVEG